MYEVFVGGGGYAPECVAKYPYVCVAWECVCWLRYLYFSYIFGGYNAIGGVVEGVGDYVAVTGGMVHV